MFGKNIVFAIFLYSAVMLKIRAYKDVENVQNFKQKYGDNIVLTTGQGQPLEIHDTVTLNKPLLLNKYFLDSVTHLVRERIPERIVHAKGAGAFGYFEVTHDITDICKAKLFNNIGKRTPLAARFSMVNQRKGSADTARDARGFAVKFYTEDGNFDFLGFNIPVYVYNDPTLFLSLIRALGPNPVTNIRDVNMIWDFLTLRPKGLFLLIYVLKDDGIPDGYRYMPGYSIHTYEVVNDKGVPHFVRFHIIPDAGIRNLHNEEAIKIAALDPDYAVRDLFNAIGNGDFPTWTLSVQVLTMDDVKNSKFNVFDITKVLPLDKYPPRPIGKIVLNRNPTNYFADVEQIAFSPGNLVPGILGAPGKAFESRVFSYKDAQNYRLGVNYEKLPINSPIKEPMTYNRDGVGQVGDNMLDALNYFPNSFDGPVPYTEENRVELLQITEEDTVNFDQIAEMYNNDMTKEERSRLIENIVLLLEPAARFLQERAIKIFKTIHSDLGERVEKGILVNATNIV